MKKNSILFIFILISLLTACTNIVNPGSSVGKHDISFSLGDEIVEEIIRSVEKNNNAARNLSVDVGCELVGNKDVNSSEEVILKDLADAEFRLRKVPLNKEFRVKIIVSYNNSIIYEGVSDPQKITTRDKAIYINIIIEKRPCTIKYELKGNGEIDNTYPVEYYVDSDFPLKDPTVTNPNLEFGGWYPDGDFRGEPVKVVGAENFFGNVTLCAKWIYKHNVGSLVAERGNNEITLKWINPGQSDFASVIISVPGFDSVKISDKTTVKKLNLPNGKKYKISVKAVDKQGNESKENIVTGETWYALTEEIEVINDIAGGKYILFGDFPQSEKAAGVKTFENVNNIGNVDYLLGDDGYFYKHEIKTGGVTGVYYKVEPIKWRVITDNYVDGSGKSVGKLLMAEKALTAFDFFDKVDGNGKSIVRNISGKTVYGNNYKYSNIRAYLNGLNGRSYNAYDYSDPSSGFVSFIDMAFSKNSRGKLVQVNVDNSVSSTGMSENKFVCENTNDKVFLMSYKEMTNPAFGFNSNGTVADSKRNRKVTDYARDKANGSGVVGGNGNTDYWLRSPSNDFDGQKTANITFNENGLLKSYDVTNNFGRVVPAIVVK